MRLGAGTGVPCPYKGKRQIEEGRSMLRGYKGKMRPSAWASLKRRPYNNQYNWGCVGPQPHYYAALVVRTMRKRALPCIMRA